MTSRLAYAVAGEIAVIANQTEEVSDDAALESIFGHAAQALGMLVSFDAGQSLDPAHENVPVQSLMARTLARSLDEQLRRPYSLVMDVHEKWITVSVSMENGLLHISVPQRRLFSSSGYIFLLWMTDPPVSRCRGAFWSRAGCTVFL